ncbi:MAG: glycoside hydrolase family 28 protein [Bacteroidota bacterium]
MKSIVSIIFSLSLFCHAQEQAAVSWKTAEEIISRVVPPQFPSKEFIVTDFGAKGDGVTDCSQAFAEAITKCSSEGGGVVIVPEGKFLTGAIYLKSNVNLHVTRNAVIVFSTDPKKYLPLVYTRWEGVELMNYSPLIYAYGEENIAVTGDGVLDGQGSSEQWWPWKGKKEYGWKNGMPNQNEGRKILMALAEKGTPVAERIFGEGYYLRPSFVQPYRCKNVYISGVTFKNSPMWFLNPTLCENVLIENVATIGHGPNNDGCDPESSRDVVITGCKFDNGDDCIAIKSGRNADGRRVNVPSENLVIRKCEMKDGHGGVVIGSEISGSVRNVFVEDCVMDSPNLDRALRFKTNSVRGGVIENFFARRITVGEVAEAVVLVDFNYEEGDAGNFTPVLRNIFVSDVTAEKGKYGFYIKGYERSPVSNVEFKNCDFKNMELPNVIEHVKDMTFTNVTINGKTVR